VAGWVGEARLPPQTHPPTMVPGGHSRSSRSLSLSSKQGRAPFKLPCSSRHTSAILWSASPSATVTPGPRVGCSAMAARRVSLTKRAFRNAAPRCFTAGGQWGRGGRGGGGRVGDSRSTPLADTHTHTHTPLTVLSTTNGQGRDPHLKVRLSGCTSTLCADLFPGRAVQHRHGEGGHACLPRPSFEALIQVGQPGHTRANNRCRPLHVHLCPTHPPAVSKTGRQSAHRASASWRYGWEMAAR
jgi:hypothetical protein